MRRKCPVSLGMMAQVGVASSLLLSVLFVVVLFMSIFIQNISSLLVYNRQVLFNIQSSVEELSRQVSGGQGTRVPPFLANVPKIFRCLPFVPPQTKCHRRWGKQGGVSVRLKNYPTKVGTFLPMNPACGPRSPHSNFPDTARLVFAKVEWTYGIFLR